MKARFDRAPRPFAGNVASLLLSALCATAVISTTPSAQTTASAASASSVTAASAPSVSTGASTTAAIASAPGKMRNGSHGDRVEARIAELRSKLKITPQQEGQWNEVTQVMRDNARTLDSLAQSRVENRGKMTAVEDLQSYSQIADAHAEGLKKFVPAFQALYDTMSESQKKQADVLFQGRNRMASKSPSKRHS